MRKDYRTSSRRDSYRWRTLRPLNCLTFLLPLLLFFQVGMIYHDTALLAPKDLGRILGFFGGTAAYLPTLLIVAVLLIQHVFHRDPLAFQPKVLLGMAAESVLWAVPMVVLIQFTGALFGRGGALAAAGAASPTVFQRIHLAVGAGIFEEFIFRLCFVSLTLVLFVDVFSLPRDLVAAVAVLAGAVAFSLYHLPPDQIAGPDPFPWSLFLFRTAAGIYLGLLFVFRGFAVAVGAHTLYNVYMFFSLP